MGMILALNALSDEKIEEIFANPKLLWKTLTSDESEEDDFLQCSGNIYAADYFGMQQEAENTDLDKAWHAIHFMLTGSAWEGKAPLNFLICGGKEIDQSDTGYGPSRAMFSNETLEIKKELDLISIDEFRRRYNPAEMMQNQIYPDIWDRYDEQNKNLEYLVEKFELLKDFIDQAYLKSFGLIITIC